MIPNEKIKIKNQVSHSLTCYFQSHQYFSLAYSINAFNQKILQVSLNLSSQLDILKRLISQAPDLLATNPIKQSLDLIYYSNYYKFDKILVMGKKTKKIQKEVHQDQPEVHPEVIKKESETSPHQLQHLITQNLKKKFSDYIDFIDEVYNLKQNLTGESYTEEIEEKKNRIASRVQQAASVIFKDESKELEEWIIDQKIKMEEEIRKINKAYEDNRGSLMQTGSFSEQEVKVQLEHIQKKVDQKKKIYDNYNQLLTRSKSLLS